MSGFKSYPMKMRPAFKDYIWGGDKLREAYNKQSDLPQVAESWEVSTHPDGLSVVANGGFKGQTLRSAVGELPVLIKLIDARENLSLQVHPNDEYAYRNEGQAGKDEMCYILEAEPGAELILGFNKTYGREELRKLIESGDILQAVRRVPVRAGDCYTIPAGLLHAIGKGIVIAEVQQSSNVTYRIYDYGRADSSGGTRELHIDKALDVLDTAAAAGKADSNVSTDWRHFRSGLIVVEELGVRREGLGANAGFECLTVVDAERNGTVILKYGTGELQLRKGESVFIPAGMGGYMLETDSRKAMVLSIRARAAFDIR